MYSSAQSSLLNYNDVYSKAFAWDGITDNVNIRIAMYTPGMPTNNFFAVVGEDLGSSYYGKINAYNSSGAEISMDSNWYSVKITMNNNGIFSCVLNPKQAAAKTFIHEVGHALKLSHPIQQGGLDGHQYSGKPVAIMNQGSPNGSYVPTTVATHDRQNLTAKWGA